METEERRVPNQTTGAFEDVPCHFDVWASRIQESWVRPEPNLMGQRWDGQIDNTEFQIKELPGI